MKQNLSIAVLNNQANLYKAVRCSHVLYVTALCNQPYLLVYRRSLMRVVLRNLRILQLDWSLLWRGE